MIRPTLAALFFLGAAGAQEFRASLSGEITDPSGAAISGATITVTNVNRNTDTVEVSNSLGRYVVNFLSPGAYNVTVDKPGFKKLVRQGIRLSSSDKFDLDLRLEVGSISEAVTVTGEPPQLQTESASRSALIENRVIESVPTNGRNLYQLVYDDCMARLEFPASLLCLD